MSTAAAPLVRWEVRLHSPIMAMDVLLPFVAFQLLTRFVHGLPIAAALALGAVFPALSCAVCLARTRRPEVVAITTLGALGVCLVVAGLGGDARLTPLFVTVTFGVVLLASLPLHRPVFFAFAREVHAGWDPARRAAFDVLREHPVYRGGFRRMTLTWGLVAVAEFAVQVVLYLTLPLGPFAILSTVLKFGSIVAVTLWTIVYARRLSARGSGAGAAR